MEGFRGISNRLGPLALLAFNILMQVDSSGRAVEPGWAYNFKSFVDGHCLTANAYDFHTDIGVFLGQVSLEKCEESKKSQKWGVILWSKSNDKEHFWLYPRQNGLNVITAIPYPDEPLPEKNLLQLVPLKNSHQTITFLMRSVELNQCVLSRGKENAITYEPCNPRIKEQLWTTNATSEDPVEHSISDRSFFGTAKDFVVYTGKKIIDSFSSSTSSSYSR